MRRFKLVSLVLMLSLTLFSCTSVPPETRQLIESFGRHLTASNWTQLAELFAKPATIEFFWYSSEGTVFHPDKIAEHFNMPPRWTVPNCYVSLDKNTDHDLSTGCSVVGDLTPVATAYSDDGEGWVHRYRAQLVSELRDPIADLLRFEYGHRLFDYTFIDHVDFKITNARDVPSGGFGTAIITIVYRYPYENEIEIRTRSDEVEFSLVRQGDRRLLSHVRIISSLTTSEVVYEPSSSL